MQSDAPEDLAACLDPQWPVPHPIEQHLGYQLRRIVTLLSAHIDRQVEPLGLTDAQWKPLLRLLLDQTGTVAALARICQLDAGGMTRLLDRLETKGLVRRERSLEDRRVVNIELTDEGRTAAQQLPDMLQGMQRSLLQGFSAEEEAQLRGFLGRLYANAQALEPGSAPGGPDS